MLASSAYTAPGTIGSGTPNTGAFTSLSATSVTDSGLTAGRVNYNGTGGLLVDSANMTFNGTNLVLSNALGVGVTPSAWGVKAIQTTGGISAFVGDTRQYFGCNFYIDSGIAIKYITSNYALNYAQDATGGTHVWSTATSGTAGNTATLNEYMRINASGYLLVGTTTAPSVANMATGYSTTSYWQYGASTTGSGNFWVLNSSNTGVALVNGNTAWQAQSDARLKNVIGKYETPLADIAQIEAVKFTWKTDLTNKPQVGVLAQSVKSVVPESVETAKLPSTSDETEYLSVKYTELIPLMIASIQELSSKVTALEAQLGVK
jgi:hypothetical protein